MNQVAEKLDQPKIENFCCTSKRYLFSLEIY
jgi:hypothetical protein